MSRTIPWTRVLAEGLAIVVSILLAFGIQAWWDNRQATLQARRDLEGVLAELAEARLEIERGLASHDRFLQGAVALRDELLAVGPGEPVVVPDTLVYSLIFTVWVTEAPTALMDAFAASGHFAHLRNDGLRERMLQWQTLLTDLQGDELRVRTFHDGELIPYAGEISDLTHAWPTVTAWVRRNGGRYPGGFATSGAVSLGGQTRLPSTLKLRNLVTQAVDWDGLIRAESVQALATLDSLTVAVHEELR